MLQPLALPLQLPLLLLLLLLAPILPAFPGSSFLKPRLRLERVLARGLGGIAGMAVARMLALNAELAWSLLGFVSWAFASSVPLLLLCSHVGGTPADRAHVRRRRARAKEGYWHHGRG